MLSSVLPNRRYRIPWVCHDATSKSMCSRSRGRGFNELKLQAGYPLAKVLYEVRASEHPPHQAL